MDIGKSLLILGALLFGIGSVLTYAPWLLQWFGRLPGDIRIERENTFILIPLTSMLVLSIGLSFLGYFFRR